ncbi:hypothetical protein TSOC_003389 [Tetrabaena socialis]|uniref:Polycystin cation channel PKD1/PKD2 domain-containing protein n=1 Tax=Tetrabaena socialis TaxID=47790 RepID=A0A2J8ABL2_9CHLO|nr:hypothetical protein TSOC_003389 [Tetrabaena socialis]|eukprot:PNH09915.1 hypothetical protein TSOC_003389 [Tetrabaena socialis]
MKEEAHWRDLEATETEDPPPCLNALQLQQQYPNQFIQYLKHQGVVYLGEACVAASDLPDIFGSAAFITRGSRAPDLKDWYRDWRTYRVNVHNAAAPGELGLLRPLLRRWQMGSCSAAAFGLPAVQAVVAYKWDRFARRLLLQQLGAYVLWLGAFTAFMLLFNSADAAVTDRELLSSWQGRAAVTFEAVALLAMAPFAAGELCVLSAYGLRGWLTAWNMLDCATYGMQITITVLHLGLYRDGPFWLTLAVAVQAVLLVVRLTYFSRVFRSTTFDFMGSLQAVSREVGWYVAVLLLLMWGFACAFYTIFRSDPAADSFGSLPMSVLTMLNYASYWRDLEATGIPEDAAASRDPPRCLDVLQLQQQYPNEFIQYLKHRGIVLLGEACVAATELPRILGGAAFITRGSREPGLKDWYREWRAYRVNVHHAAAPGELGLLRPLLRRWQMGSCSAAAFGLPAVQAVVAYKWDLFARRLLLQQLGAYVLWLGAFTAFMLLFRSSDAAVADRQLLSSWRGRAAVASEAMALLGMAPFAAGELCVLSAYGLRGWMSTWNVIDSSTYGVQIAMTVLHLGTFRNGPFWLTLAVAVQAVLLVVRLTYFSRVFRSTTFDFVGSLQYVSREVGPYVAVLLLLMWGFAGAFYTILEADPAPGFGSLPLSFLTMFNYAVGGTSYYTRELLASHHPAIAVVLCTIYQFTISMLLMSLLTGVMTSSLMRVIDELETVLPWRLLASYGDDEPYVHVLRVSPKSLERIDEEGQEVDMWSPRQDGGSGGGGGDADEDAVAAADTAMAAEEPLLQAYWRDLEATGVPEAAAASRDPPRCLDVLQLQQQYPNQFIQYLKHQGMVHLGEACVAATELPGIFGGAAFVTRGSKEPGLKDWYRDWRAYRVNVHHAAAPGELGLLRPLLRRWQMGSCSAAAFGLPAVQAVVAYKWDLFARRLLLQQLGAYVLWLGAFTAFMLLFRSSDAAVEDRQLLSSWKGRAAVASEAVALLGMAPFAASELCVLSAYGLRGWASAWNMIDSSTYGMQIAITVLHLGTFRDGPFWLTLAVAVQAVLLVVRLTYFSRVFRSTTFDLMGSLQSVAQEVGWYVAVLLLLMWGFAGAFYTILQADPTAEGFGSLPISFLTMFNYAASRLKWGQNYADR